ncbi:hypothetical protein [Streptomyces sp. NPDC127103]|uniref:hypothetical protein n=1 Tax=Streptomyces sp. NPDC127103 TaxID=3347139 RepID=UPI0036544C21
MISTATIPQTQAIAFVAVSFHGPTVGMNVYLPGAPCADCLRQDYGDPMVHKLPPCSRAEGHATVAVNNWGHHGALFEARATEVDEARAKVRAILAACPSSGPKALDLPQGCAWSDVEAGPVHAGHPYAIAPGRRILAGQWAAVSPAECTETSNQGVWISDQTAEVLICPGCGLDCT